MSIQCSGSGSVLSDLSKLQTLHHKTTISEIFYELLLDWDENPIQDPLTLLCHLMVLITEIIIFRY